MWQEPDLFGDEALEAVDGAISQAVERQLVSDVPVGTFLSGGIDSPLVAAKIAQPGHGSVKAFTIGLAGHSRDESTDATRYAVALGMPHCLRHFTEADVLALLDDVVAACGEPFADYSIFPTMLVSRLARREVKVMLGGDGGDAPQCYVQSRNLPDSTPHDLFLELDVVGANVGQGTG